MSTAKNKSASQPATTITLNLPSGHIIFEVTEKMSSLAHEGKTYPVLNGKIILPASERWYDDLIRAGVLKLPK